MREPANIFGIQSACYAIIAGVLLSAGACIVNAAPINPSPMMDSALVCLVNQEYDAANAAIRNILKKDSRNPDALYMLLTIHQLHLLDYESYEVDGHRFAGLADSVIEILKQELETSRGADSVRCLFYIGNVYGGKGLILAKCGNWLMATREALTSVSMLKKVKELDPQFYAAYLGIGVFNYYLSQNLKWIPFMGDKSKQGIREIELATTSRFPYNYGAKNSLAWILIDRGNYRKADSIVSGVLSEYPDNTIFLRIKTCIALWSHKYKKAAEAGKKLLKLSRRRNPVNWSDLMLSYQVLAASYDNLGDKARCIETVKEGLSMEVPVQTKKISHVRKHIAYLRHLEKKYASSK